MPTYRYEMSPGMGQMGHEILAWGSPSMFYQQTVLLRSLLNGISPHVAADVKHFSAKHNYSTLK